MGILKTIGTDYGETINATYWRIDSIWLDTRLKKGKVVFKGFSEKGNYKPLAERVYEEEFGEDINDLTFFDVFIYEYETGLISVVKQFDNVKPIDTSWIITYIYNLLKTKDEFVGAIDDI